MRRAPLLLASLSLVLAPLAPAKGLAKGELARISIGPGGEEAAGTSVWPDVSSNGRYVAFQSGAANLVAADGNAATDVFVFDRKKGVTERVSLTVSGVEGDLGGLQPAISANGRYVAFRSSSDLLEEGVPTFHSVFVRDRKKGKTERVSVKSDGAPVGGHANRPAISGDGRFVAFVTVANFIVPGDTPGTNDVFLHDRKTGETVVVTRRPDGTPAGGDPDHPSISGDGRFVAFDSLAADIVADDTNGVRDVFVFDRKTGAVERVTVGHNGSEADGPSGDAPGDISASGRYVTFSSSAANLVPGDANGTVDVFVVDRKKGVTTLASVRSDGGQGNSLSGQPSISPDGRYVGFYSYAANLVGGDQNQEVDVFLHDRKKGTTIRLSQDEDGVGGDDTSGRSSLSAKAKYIAFESLATNIVEDVTNVNTDIYLRRR